MWLVCLTKLLGVVVGDLSLNNYVTTNLLFEVLPFFSFLSSVWYCLAIQWCIFVIFINPLWERWTFLALKSSFLSFIICLFFPLCSCAKSSCDGDLLNLIIIPVCLWNHQDGVWIVTLALTHTMKLVFVHESIIWFWSLSSNKNSLPDLFEDCNNYVIENYRCSGSTSESYSP